MPGKILLFVCAGFLVFGLCSCAEQQPNDVAEAQLTPYASNTVAEYAYLVGGELSVQGYGVVVGLGQNGSAEVPANVRNYLTDYLAKRNLGSARANTMELTPARFLSDLDTAVVLVAGTIPAGAPAGTRFDLTVNALPRTQTKSLDGGLLMPAELHMALRGISTPGGPSRKFADARGEVFLNPFIDRSTPSGAAQRRTGAIPGGGTVTVPQAVVLRLRQPAYEIANVLQKRINLRFPNDPPVAVAKNSSTIELKIPARRRDDYRNFLRLVMHLPIRPGAEESHARQIAAAMNQPNANCDELSLVWEAMGRQVVPLIKAMYVSKNAPEAFYSARTGLRLGDRAAMEVILRFAVSSGSPFQIPAIEELGKCRRRLRARTTLRQLIQDDNEMVRLAAYEALHKLSDRTFLKRIDLGHFVLDVVPSQANPVIYATRSMEQRMVLFGGDMKILQPAFFNAPDDLVTINLKENSDKLTVWRKIPWDGTSSDSFEIAPSVQSLVKTLGSPPVRDDDGRVAGLGLTFSQVAGVLHGMCTEGDIQAKFVLQAPPGVQRIYRGAASVGRPDTPEP